MTDVLDAMPLGLLSGNEQLTAKAGPPLRVLDYWRWSGSGLMENTQRGVLAEFLVAAVLGVHGTPREEWGNYDLETECSGRTIRIEVKSSAERQSWQGAPAGFLEFDIRRTEDSWGKVSGVRRWADVYVFCILRNRNAAAQIEALDTGNWEFLVLPTAVIDRKRPLQKSFREGPLRQIGAVSTDYMGLAGTIARVAKTPA